MVVCLTYLAFTISICNVFGTLFKQQGLHGDKDKHNWRYHESTQIKRFKRRTKVIIFPLSSCGHTFQSFWFQLQAFRFKQCVIVNKRCIIADDCCLRKNISCTDARDTFMLQFHELYSSYELQLLSLSELNVLSCLLTSVQKDWI